MTAILDKATGKWYCQFYYTDWTGERKGKKKRGFAKKREALEWERNFLQQSQGDTKITFGNFVTIYFDDMGTRLRQSSVDNKKWTCEHKILPYFKDKLIDQITASDVRK